MEPIRFEGISMKDALKKVKEDLGKDAVIIQTREREKSAYPNGPLHKVVEILAAPAASRQEPKKRDGIYRPVFPVINTRDGATVVKNSQRSTLPPLGQGIKRPTGQEETQLNAPRTPALPSSQSHDLIQNQTERIHTELEQLRAQLRRLPQVNIGEQLQEVKVILHNILREQSTGSNRPQLRPEIDDILIRLRSAGVLSSEIAALQSFLLGSEPPEQVNASDHYLSKTIRYVVERIPTGGWIGESQNQQEIHCLIGPSGVGKTTLMGKLAASTQKRKGKQIALFDLDEMRLSSVDQLKVYSKILECPYAEVQDLQAFQRALDAHFTADVILLDTAGRSAQDQSQTEFLKALKEKMVPIQFHAVLSATTKERDLEETLRSYQHLGLRSVIFTKLDESWAFGEMFNISRIFNIPISYFSTGPSVPEDIEIATKERVVERLLRL